MAPGNGCDVDAPRNHPVWLLAAPDAGGAGSRLLRRAYG
jgi:hypothetical protein